MNVNKKKFFSRFFKKLLVLFFILVVVALFYLVAILIEPEGFPDQTKESFTFLPNEVLSAQAPLHINTTEEIVNFVNQFPASILFFQETDNLRFLGGDMFDTAYQKSFARIVRLSYEVSGIGPVYLHCIYPKNAFDLLEKEKLHLVTSQEKISNFPAIRMEGKETVRLHAQGNLALYSLTAPILLKEDLSALGKTAVFLAQPFDEAEVEEIQPNQESFTQEEEPPSSIEP